MSGDDANRRGRRPKLPGDAWLGLERRGADDDASPPSASDERLDAQLAQAGLDPKAIRAHGQAMGRKLERRLADGDARGRAPRTQVNRPLVWLALAIVVVALVLGTRSMLRGRAPEAIRADDGGLPRGVSAAGTTRSVDAAIEAAP
jgi:hypothetical protein